MIVGHRGIVAVNFLNCRNKPKTPQTTGEFHQTSYFENHTLKHFVKREIFVIFYDFFVFAINSKLDGIRPKLNQILNSVGRKKTCPWVGGVC